MKSKIETYNKNIMSTIPEFIGEPDLKSTYKWNYKGEDYALMPFKNGCRAWKKEANGKFFKPTVINYPLILPSYKKINLLSDFEFASMESFYQYKEFIASIPKNIKLLISELGKYQYLALEATYYIEEFKDFLKQEQECKSLNYIIAIWSLSLAHNMPFTKRISLVKNAIYSDRCKMLSSLLYLPSKKRLLKILNKFIIDDIDNDLISILYYLSSDNKLYTALRNNIVLKKSIISKMYYELPDWLITEEIINALNALPKHIDSLKSVFPPVILNAEQKRQKEILKVLKDVTTYQSLENKFAILTQRLVLKEKFPPPPFKGSKRLEAISTGDRLKQEGLQMHNCVAGYIDSVLNNESYFYHWDDKSGEPATVQVSINKDYNYWYLEEALGFDNEELTKKTVFKIKKEVIRLMPDKKLPIGTCEVAGTYYYELKNKWDEINKTSKIILQREPNNEYDALAIIVFLEINGNFFKLGYIPRYRNNEFAKLLDINQKLRADVIEKNENDSYKDIEILISLIDPLIEI